MSTPELFVTCFCAAWCRTCDAYDAVIHEIRAQYGERVAVRWLDIEEHSEVLDDIDVENFPTLLVADAKQTYFFGPVLPYAAAAKQLIDRGLARELPAQGLPEVLALQQRVLQS
jgi:thioredoxin-like negative regulator of GroEL